IWACSNLAFCCLALASMSELAKPLSCSVSSRSCFCSLAMSLLPLEEETGPVVEVVLAICIPGYRQGAGKVDWRPPRARRSGAPPPPDWGEGAPPLGVGLPGGGAPGGSRRGLSLTSSHGLAAF